jgi:hypothetical protein
MTNAFNAMALSTALTKEAQDGTGISVFYLLISTYLILSQLISIDSWKYFCCTN